MKFDTIVTGIGTSMQERAAALIALAIARRGPELAAVPARRQGAGGATTAKPSSAGGK